ncbi:hypothetical protein LEP1GSC188_2578 [Leptospira weilii serovar Topaz str. LT2116]|uniref:Uncharacterized protein n=1 Tax=Leptospira weilii serovar Topaz str. LT2116 TaxID=1088540 RepID=M3GUC1_9LEPT|nr:hypothetical protein LEP1GSC188_2578 [Leptospira weilii serovar Topaz str. LT2116]
MESNVLGKRFKIFLLISISDPVPKLQNQKLQQKSSNNKVCLKTHNYLVRLIYGNITTFYFDFTEY